MEYNYDEESVNALKEWVDNTQWPNELRLSESEMITDVKQYVLANLNDIKAHYPDAFYNPSILRLYRLKEKMEEEGV